MKVNVQRIKSNAQENWMSALIPSTSLLTITKDKSKESSIFNFNAYQDSPERNRREKAISTKQGISKMLRLRADNRKSLTVKQTHRVIKWIEEVEIDESPWAKFGITQRPTLKSAPTVNDIMAGNGSQEGNLDGSKTIT